MGRKHDVQNLNPSFILTDNKSLLLKGTKSQDINCSLNYDNHNNDVDVDDGDDGIELIFFSKELKRSTCSSWMRVICAEHFFFQTWQCFKLS